LIDGSLNALSLQAGYGTHGQLTVSLGTILQTQSVGDGTFAALSAQTSGGISALSPLIRDINGDGRADLIYASSNGTTLNVGLGNGDGTFGSFGSYGIGTIRPSDMELSDLNGDGVLDAVVVGDLAANRLAIFYGNSNGSFAAGITTYFVGTDASSVELGDFNEDGKSDILISTTGNTVRLLLSNSDGTFLAPVSYMVNSGLAPPKIADLNSDGNLDFVVSSDTDDQARVYLGTGTGGFSAPTSFGIGNSSNIALGDFTGDGIIDFVSTSNLPSDRVIIYGGTGSGSFGSAITSTLSATVEEMQVSDLNSDGRDDLILRQQDDRVRVLLGNGDGTFQLGLSYATGSNAFGLAMGDLNGDSVDEVIATAFDGTINAYLANATATGGIQGFDLRTQSSSLDALTMFQGALRGVTLEIGNIGSFQSRIMTAVATLSQTTENYSNAVSRIVDIDVASESAQLVRSQIIQQAATGVLAQANLQPQLVLSLLR